MRISHIVATSKNRVIGKDNNLPWHIPEDLKFFREKTKNHIMIMGRKTFESLKSPLPNRFHFIITRNKDFKLEHPNVRVVSSLDEALAQAKTLTPQWGEEVFIIGGGEIYKQSINQVDRIYITVIDQVIEGDTYYPEIPQSRYTLSEERKVAVPIPHSYQTWDKR